MDWELLLQATNTKLKTEFFSAYTTEGVTVGVAINATPTAFAAAEGMLTIDNTASVNSGDKQFIVPIAIDMICTAAGDGTFWAVQLVKDNATQWSSGGSTLAAAALEYDTRTSYSDRTPKGSIHFGDLTLVTGSSRVTIGQYPIQAIQDGFTVGDHVRFQFGMGGAGSTMNRLYDAGVATGAAIGPAKFIVDLPPVWIGRGSSLILQPFATIGSSAASFTVNVLTVEMGHPRETA